MRRWLRRGGRKPVHTALVAVAIGALGPACVDITPITVVDASLTSDTGDAAVDARSPCRDCLEGVVPDGGPGCSAEVAKCFTFKTCALTYQCALAEGCLEGRSFKSTIDCGIPCAQKAGLLDQTSPEAAAVVELVACAQSTCAVACHNGDDAGK